MITVLTLENFVCSQVFQLGQGHLGATEVTRDSRPVNEILKDLSVRFLVRQHFDNLVQVGLDLDVPVMTWDLLLGVADHHDVVDT